MNVNGENIVVNVKLINLFKKYSKRKAQAGSFLIDL